MLACCLSSFLPRVVVARAMTTSSLEGGPYWFPAHFLWQTFAGKVVIDEYKTAKRKANAAEEQQRYEEQDRQLAATEEEAEAELELEADLVAEAERMLNNSMESLYEWVCHGLFSQRPQTCTASCALHPVHCVLCTASCALHALHPVHCVLCTACTASCCSRRLDWDSEICKKHAWCAPRKLHLEWKNAFLLGMEMPVQCSGPCILLQDACLCIGWDSCLSLEVLQARA